MLLWHLGATCAIVVMALGVRRIDYRVVLLGALLPDLIDKPLGRIFLADRFETGRLFGHTLAFVTLALLAIQLLLRGKTARRWFILPIAALIHLVLDGMWSLPVNLFWPLFGTTFPPEPVDGYWLEALLRPFTSPWTLAGELAGAALLVYLYRAFRLQIPGNRRAFLLTGELVDRSVPATRPPHEGAEPATRPGKEGAEPATRPGKEGAEPATRPGKEGAEPATRPGKEGTEPATRPGKEGTEPATRPPDEGAEPATRPGKEKTET
ncbi:MAG: metal-dependent hydrolase [Actinomycetota bacterium]